MKKIFTAFCAAALLVNIAALTGCKPNGEGSDTLSGSDRSSMSDMSSGISENNSAEISQSEPEIPKGEPTFLICPDGTPVYTSEISEVYTGSEWDGNKETITFEQAEQYARACEGEFNVKCEGFSYGFIPERALNCVDDPEMFKEAGNGENFDFVGEELDEYGYGKFSTDYIRIKTGDKFGTLTVKSAYTLFSNDRFLKEFSETPGAYISGGAIEFDGEVELTGYVNVWEDTDYQGAGGTMIFYPDGDSSMKIPIISYEYSMEHIKGHHRGPHSVGYYGDWECSLGNMSEVECDVSGLHKGDVFVKVKITADSVTSGHGGVRLKLKTLEVL